MEVSYPRDLLNLSLVAAGEIDDSRLAGLLGYLSEAADVAFSRATPTACVRRQGDRYVIEFNRTFVRRRIETPSELLFVLLHEILHKTRGDLLRDSWKNLGPIGRAVANLTADVRINRILCRDVFPRGVPLLSRLYRSDRFPDILLVPPMEILNAAAPGPATRNLSWSETNRRKKSVRAAVQERLARCSGLPPADDPNKETDELAAWYMDAYFKDKASTQSLFERLRGWFRSEPKLLFLGDHEESDGPGADLRNGLMERRIDLPAVERLSPHRRLQAQTLLCAIRAALEPDPFCTADHAAYTKERSVLPSAGRREALLLAEGVWPVFFKRSPLPRDVSDHRVHLYIDVSASTKEVQPFLYSLVLHLSELVGEPLYLFSNRVVPVTLRDLRLGISRTTGGTDLDCIIEHAVQNHFRKVLIVTDGFAYISADCRERVLRGEVILFAVLTESGGASVLKDLARRVWRLHLEGRG